MVKKEFKQKLKGAVMKKLTTREQNKMKRYWVKGLSFREIVKLLDNKVSVETVSRYLKESFRAKNKTVSETGKWQN